MVYFVSVLKYVTDLPNTCRALPLAWREGYVLGDEINATNYECNESPIDIIIVTFDIDML